MDKAGFYLRGLLVSLVLLVLSLITDNAFRLGEAEKRFR